MLRTGVVFLIVTAAFSGCTDSSTTPADAPEQARPQSSRTSKQGGDPPNNAFPGRDPAPQKGFTYQPLMDFRVPFATAPGQASPTKQVEIGGNYTTVRVTSERWGTAASYVNAGWTPDSLGSRANWANGSVLARHHFGLICCWIAGTAPAKIESQASMAYVAPTPTKATFTTEGWGVDMYIHFRVDVATPIPEANGNQTIPQES